MTLSAKQLNKNHLLMKAMATGAKEMKDITQTQTNAASLMRAEIDMQVATAKSYPRDMVKVIREAKQLVKYSPNVAQSCIYTLKRGNNVITGPSIRFAEIIRFRYGNIRTQTIVVAEQEESVIVRGIAHDLETNAATSSEVQRPIVSVDKKTKKKKRYSRDMITVTINAASAIAVRNAILSLIPEAFWASIYEEVKHTLVPENADKKKKLDSALVFFTKHGVNEETLCKYFAVGIPDALITHLEAMHGLATRLIEGETPEEIFGTLEPEKPKLTKQQEANQKAAARSAAQANNNAANPQKD